MTRIRCIARLMGETVCAVSPGHVFLAPAAAAMRIGLLLALLLSVGALSKSAQAQSTNQAAVIVVHGDGRLATRCVSFAEPQITGSELLQRAGLELNLEASSMGATICRIDGEGCTFPQQSCFCQCEGPTCTYWAYWRWENGEWRYSQLGASNSAVAPGSLDAWVWGSGADDSAPPPITFAQVCAPPTQTATATAVLIDTSTPDPALNVAVATNTPTPTMSPTFTPVTSIPTSTSLPTPPPATSTPSPVPVATSLPTFTATWSATATSLPAAPPAPIIEVFTADRHEIMTGETVTLSWRIRNANAAELQASGKAVSIALEGSLLLAPPQNTTYQLVAVSGDSSASTAMTIIVRPRQVASAGLSRPAVATTAPALPTGQLLVASPPAVTSAEQIGSVLLTPGRLPTMQPSPTLAPLALAPATRTGVSPGAPRVAPAAATTEVISLMFAGLLALAGIPLLGIVAMLAFWWLRRMGA